MTPQELKNSILQLAIAGKLVEQRAEEGTAEELFAQIQAEKQRLVAEGKLKKQKPLPEITEEEKPFDIPESWKWVRWGNLSLSIQYGYNAPGKTSGTIKMVRISDIQNNKINWSNVPWCEIPDDDIETYSLNKNDILFARTGGTVGKSFLVKNVTEKAIYAGYLIRTRYSEKLEPQYLKFFMESTLYWLQLREGTIATAQPNCNGKVLANMILPLPPLAEQKRIVAKIEQLLPYIDRYEKAWSRLQEFNKRFPSDMQKSLLQYAIEGKLVEQRAEEGTAEELFAQIQAEKQRLVAEGKLKKQKPLPEITEEEKPFDIPESWKWVRLGEVCIFENGDRSKKYPVESDYVKFGIPFFGAKDIVGKYLSFDNVRFISSEKFNELGNGKLRNQDFICLLRGSVGKCAIFKEKNDIRTGFICAQMVILRSINLDLCNYLYNYFISPVYDALIKGKITGTAVRQLAAKDLANMIFPLPPLAEQKRIVARLEELLPLCDRLKK